MVRATRKPSNDEGDPRGASAAAAELINPNGMR
jgi:hypothetical protein